MKLLTPSQLIAELYGEPDDGTFTHEGSDYNLNGILNASLGLPVENIQVSSLKWILKYDPMDRSDNIRIDRADLSAPCLIIWDPKEEKFVVIDGIHRLAKAIRDKIECLPCVKVTQELIDRYRI